MAPVEILPRRTCSAARPPRAMQVMSRICSVVMSRFSLGRYCAKPSAADPRGTMLTWRHMHRPAQHVCRNAPL